LARGLVFNPDVLLLDEPLGALDKNLREQMQAEIKRIHREVGITMIYVTHDQSEAMAMSDRIAVFGQGRLEQVGAPLDVYNKPVSRFVGAFVGDSNFFEAQLDPARPGWANIDGLGPVQLGTILPVSAPGLRVDILVRPERVRPAAELTGDQTVVDMRVQTLVDYGDSVLATGTAAGHSLRMRLPGQVHGLAEHGCLRVGWAIGDAHVIARP
jgi:putative spermidine/putrescine transport system ATP-binding protein